MTLRTMHLEEVKLMMILLFLINQDEEGTPYSMVRTMAKRYGMNDFNGYLKNSVNREFVEYSKIGTTEMYKINDEGRDFYERNKRSFRPGIEEHFPIHKELTALLMD